MEDFVAKTEKLLSLERKAEVEQCEELLSTQDSRRLESRGLCITKLSVSHQRTGLYGRNIITFTKGNKKRPTYDLPCNRFTAGMAYVMGNCMSCKLYVRMCMYCECGI